MKMLYQDLNERDLKGRTLADLLVHIEADFQIIDGSEVIYSERSFPVAELARELAFWLSNNGDRKPDFHFSSLSFECPGAVKFIQTSIGWMAESMFVTGVQSSPIPWSELVVCIDEFIAAVRRDVSKLGIDPGFIVH
ncbi:hypothetical protein NE236_15790 [Actinoallomurus purpureus]|uniref:DUF7878 domain-containing protein n=1 Tax=Actinoallomurus purpureus TaxID=478114 RepID=UPI00209268E2|nr:hypothetical protein [Actinoallomurus purpureus]MCO6006447.1 hypothetical protein [Actinoallomurus purpureus]